MNVLGRGNHSMLSSLIVATLRPLNAVELLVNSPFNVLIESETFLPDITRSFASWSNMNVTYYYLLSLYFTLGKLYKNKIYYKNQAQL